MIEFSFQNGLKIISCILSMSIGVLGTGLFHLVTLLLNYHSGINIQYIDIAFPLSYYSFTYKQTFCFINVYIR